MNLAMSMPVNATGLAVPADVPSQAGDGTTDIDRRLVDKSDLVEHALKGPKKIFGEKYKDAKPFQTKAQVALENWNRYKHNVWLAKHRAHSRFKASQHGHDQHQPRAIKSSEDEAVDGDMVDKRLVSLSWEDIRKNLHRSKEEKGKDMEKQIQEREKQQRQNKLQQWAATKGVSPYKRGQDEVSEPRDVEKDEIEKRLVDVASMKAGLTRLRKQYIGKTPQELAAEDRFRAQLLASKQYKQAQQDAMAKQGRGNWQTRAVRSDVESRDDDIQRRLVDKSSLVKSSLKGWRVKWFGKTKKEQAEEKRIKEETEEAEKIRKEKAARLYAKKAKAAMDARQP